MIGLLPKKIRKDYTILLDKDICKKLNIQPGDRILLKIKKYNPIKKESEKKKEFEEVILEN